MYVQVFPKIFNCRQPIDVVKTRLQIQGEAGRTLRVSYNGFLGGIRTVIEHEGFLGLYKGIGASLIREGIYSTIRIGGYVALLFYFLISKI